MVKLSVLVPVHNEADNIRPFYQRAEPVLNELAGPVDWEIVFINDGSQDGSLNRIFELRSADPRVKVITLSRNFGYHGVLVAGLTLCQSDLYAVVDVDCEDPPELLVEFYKAVRNNAQVAYGIRSQREEPYIITSLRALFYHINRRIADSPTVLWMAEFSMFTRQVRDAILAPHTTYPFLRAEIAYTGFKLAGIPYRRAKRQHGTSHYRIYKMVKFAIGAFLSSSTFPLRFVLYFSAVLGVSFPVVVLAFRLSFDQAVKLSALCLFYFALVVFPILALYLARTYKNGIARPVFIVDQNQTYLTDDKAAPVQLRSEQCLS